MRPFFAERNFDHFFALRHVNRLFDITVFFANYIGRPANNSTGRTASLDPDAIKCQFCGTINSKYELNCRKCGNELGY
jgi:hypothetical protein